MEHTKTNWINLENPNHRELTELADQHHLHPLHIEERFIKGQLPQIEIEDDYIFLLLYFPKYIASESRITASHVNIFLGKEYLITIYEEPTASITDLYDAYQKEGHSASPATILNALIGNLLHDINSLVDHVSQDLDKMEAQVFDDSGSDAYAIGQLRQQIVRLRRIAAPLQDILEELAEAVSRFADSYLTRHYRNNRKIAKKLWDAVGEAKETIEIYKDADFTINTERTNDILAILTLVFTLTIPATVIGALYGMNVLLPGGIEIGSWTFLGPYTTFILLVGASIIPVILMLWYFRRKRWF